MTKKPCLSRFPYRKPNSATANRPWHNGGDLEISLYSQSLRNAARALVQRLERDYGPRANWDLGPIILLYREALGLYLKLLIGEGRHFL